MKANKVIVGAVAAMLSLSVCSVAPAIAAGETVQISASTETVKAGEEFSVEVSLKDVPSTKIQGCEFAIQYDPSIISIDSIKAGAITDTGADKADPAAALIPTFDVTMDSSKGYATVTWATSLTDSTYWISKDGVFCTINGKASSSASEGDVAEIKLIPIDRDLSSQGGSANKDIRIGYVVSAKESVVYSVKSTNGAVKIGTPGPSVGDPVYGDANCDGSVDISDAVLIMQWAANPEKYAISAQGMLNADCVDVGGGVTSLDALAIQMVEAGTIKSTDLPVTASIINALQK